MHGTDETRKTAQRLVVRERSEDYHVHLEGHPDILGCGDSIDEALGDWLCTHGERLGVEVVLPKG
jgi:hypothetical protein